MVEIATIVTQLASLLPKETLLRMIPTVDNVQDELDKLAEEKESDRKDFGAGYPALAQAFQQAQAEEGVPQQPTSEGRDSA